MNKVNKIILLFFAVVLLFCTSCTLKTQKFESQRWKESGKAVRGEMVEDLRQRKLLVGITKNEVKNLLGEPNEKDTNYWNYDVITISRCYFWNCRMEINFDAETGKVDKNLVVSD